MDLRKRVEKLEKARSSAEPQPPVSSQQFEVREMTIEQWNELYVKPHEERYRGKAERTNSSDQASARVTGSVLNLGYCPGACL